jgi:hypothetical protein
MSAKKYIINGEVWLYPGMSGWHFVGIPKKESVEIKKVCKVKAGFGSIPVVVTINKSKWKTSVFPDKRTETYLLPLKAEVRKKEGIFLGNIITLTIELM